MPQSEPVKAPRHRPLRPLSRGGGVAAAVSTAVTVGALMVAVEPAQAAGPRPDFQLPFPCNQKWRLDTWAHAPALDMVHEPQSGTLGARLVAPANGVVKQSFRHGNAGNMIQIDHGGSWFTTYIHLQSRAVGVGTRVTRGQTIGRVGKDGPTSNGHPHLHFETAIDTNRDGRASWGTSRSERVRPWFNGVQYGQSNGRTWRNVVSRNCGSQTPAPPKPAPPKPAPPKPAPPQPAPPQPAPPAAHQLSVVQLGDVTGDGKSDLVGQYVHGALRAFASTGNVSGDGPLLKPRAGVKVATGWKSGDVRRIVRGDVTGDGRTDLLAQYPNGDLKAFVSTGDVSAENRLFTPGAGIKVGTGWHGYVHRIIAADVTGDGKADLIAQYPKGNIRVFVSTGNVKKAHRLFTPGSGLPVGKGLTRSGVPRLLAADVTGDGKSDLIAQYASGELKVFASTGNVSGANKLFRAGTKVATGWSTSNVQRILTGDVDGDRRSDLIAQYPSGELKVFASTGDVSGANKLLRAGTRVGTGWTAGFVERILTGDVNGDRKSDLIAQYRNGDLKVFTSTGKVTGDKRLFTPDAGTKVGTGWTTSYVPRIT